MSHRHFGIMSGSADLGGASINRPTSDAYNTCAEPIQSADRAPSLRGLRPDSSSFGWGLFIREIKQALIDTLAVVVGILLIASVALSVPLAIFMMLFCTF